MSTHPYSSRHPFGPEPASPDNDLAGWQRTLLTLMESRPLTFADVASWSTLRALDYSRLIKPWLDERGVRLVDGRLTDPTTRAKIAPPPRTDKVEAAPEDQDQDENEDQDDDPAEPEPPAEALVEKRHPARIGTTAWLKLRITERQDRLVEHLRSRGPTSFADLCAAIGVNTKFVRNQFDAVLRTGRVASSGPRTKKTTRYWAVDDSALQAAAARAEDDDPVLVSPLSHTLLRQRFEAMLRRPRSWTDLEVLAHDKGFTAADLSAMQVLFEQHLAARLIVRIGVEEPPRYLMGWLDRQQEREREARDARDARPGAASPSPTAPTVPASPPRAPVAPAVRGETAAAEESHDSDEAAPDDEALADDTSPEQEPDETSEPAAEQGDTSSDAPAIRVTRAYLANVEERILAHLREHGPTTRDAVMKALSDVSRNSLLSASRRLRGAYRMTTIQAPDGSFRWSARTLTVPSSQMPALPSSWPAQPVGPSTEQRAAFEDLRTRLDSDVLDVTRPEIPAEACADQSPSGVIAAPSPAAFDPRAGDPLVPVLLVRLSELPLLLARLASLPSPRS